MQGLHGRDVDLDQFLQVVLELQGGIGLAIWYDVADLLGYPRRVVLQRARLAESAGLIDGCTCGCNGHWKLTPAGQGRLFGVPVTAHGQIVRPASASAR